MANAMLENNGKLSKRGTEEEIRNLCKSGDSLITASAAVAIDINLPKFRTSAAMLLRVTSEEKNCFFGMGGAYIMTQRQRSHFAGVFYRHLQKYRSSFAPISNGKPPSVLLVHDRDKSISQCTF